MTQGPASCILLSVESQQVKTVVLFAKFDAEDVLPDVSCSGGNIFLLKMNKDYPFKCSYPSISNCFLSEGPTLRAKMRFTLLRVGMLGLLMYCCAGNAPKTNRPSIRPEGPDVGAFESGRQGVVQQPSSAPMQKHRSCWRHLGGLTTAILETPRWQLWGLYGSIPLFLCLLSWKPEVFGGRHQGGRWIKTHSHIRDLEFEPVNILS